MPDLELISNEWHVRQIGGDFYIEDDKDNTICDFAMSDFTDRQDKVHANLIKAAPKLIEALEKIADINPYTITTEEAYEIIDIAGVVLSQARGEEIKK